MPVRSSTLSCLYLLFLFLFSSFFASEEFSFATCMSLEAFVHVLGFILRFIVMMKEALRKLDCERSIFRSVGLSVCLFMSWNFLYVFVVCCVLVVDGSCTSVFCSLFTLQFKTSGKKYCGVALVMTYDSKASGFFLDLLSSCVCVCVFFGIMVRL